MSEGVVFSCPQCGGPVAAGDRHCSYCSAPIATVRCARCYAMNTPDAAHCSGCGLGLGLEPIGHVDTLKCPDCALSLTGYGSGAGVLRDCGHCGGQFVDHALLRELIEGREMYGIAAPRTIHKGNPLSQPVRYRKCPACATIMNRRNFGQASGIIVDQCTVHGTWFDPGELPRIMAFIESGGLVLARKREVEQLERKRREVVTSSIAEQHRMLYASEQGNDAGELYDVVVALMKYLISLVKHP